MIEIYLLEQLVALAEYGTLSEAAEHIHLTQPTLTRSMQKLETQIGVPLFERENKKIKLNDIGNVVADYARKIISLENEMQQSAVSLERAKHIMSIGCIAPVPIKEFVPILADYCSSKTLQSEVKDEKYLLDGLYANQYQMIVLNRPIEDENCLCIRTFSEQLYYCFPPVDHPISQQGVYFSDINGITMLMPSEVGFWRKIVKEHMPNSKFIEQNTNEEINMIIENSSFASFNTDVAMKHNIKRPNRIEVPILDEDAVTYYYCICLKDSIIGNALIEKLKQLY